MKKVIFFILLLAGYMPVKAQGRYPGVLRVQLSDNSPIVVGIDGRHYNTHGTTITVTDLPAGKHFLKIYTYTPYNDGAGGRAHLIYEGNVHVYNDAGTLLVLDANNGNVNVARVPFPDNNPQEENKYNDESTADSQPNNGQPDSMVSPPETEASQLTDAPKTYPEAAKPPFTARDIDRLDVKVNKKITDTDKLKLIETALKGKSVTTAQVGTMMTWLMFDNSKAELAKWTYGRTTDKENYVTLENELTYPKTKADLDNYIKAQ